MDIDSFVEGLTSKNGEPAQPETKRRARLALTSFTEFLTERGKSWPDKTDYEDYATQQPDNSTTKQRLSYIRRYYGFEERSNTVMVETENTTTLNTEKKEKKKQVSVYLERDTYETLKVLAQATSTSIGDILSNCATRIAKKHKANGILQQATEALQALSNITLEYDA